MMRAIRKFFYYNTFIYIIRAAKLYYFRYINYSAKYDKIQILNLKIQPSPISLYKILLSINYQIKHTKTILIIQYNNKYNNSKRKKSQHKKKICVVGNKGNAIKIKLRALIKLQLAPPL